MSAFSKRGARGCGRNRIPGSLYLEVGLAEAGEPGGVELEHFIIDPAQPWVGETLSARGVAIVDYNGAKHVVDVIGSEHYPTPADFIEEARWLGVSRRVNPKLDFSGLDPRKSKLIVLHGKAIISNLERVFEDGLGDMLDEAGAAITGTANVMQHICPRFMSGARDRAHLTSRPNCLGLHWAIHTGNDGPGRRRIGEISYPVHYREGFLNTIPEYQIGVIAVLPITGFSVIESPGSPAADEIYDRVSGLNYPVQRTRE